MRSEQEILAIVCRIVQEHTVGHPKITANTKIANLTYFHPPQPGYSDEHNANATKNTAKKSTSYNLMFPILKEFSWDRNHLWSYPDAFNWNTSHKKCVTIQDYCKIVHDGFVETAEALALRDAEENKKANFKKDMAKVRTIDCDELLNGDPTWPEVQKYFLEEEFDDEPYLVQAIKTHLITPAQKEMLFKHNLSIEDTLNGRYGGAKGEDVAVEKMYKAWNKKLGFQHFGG